MLIDVETSRVQLRVPEYSNAEALFGEVTSNAEVTRFLSWRTHVFSTETSDFIGRVISSDCLQYGITRVLRNRDREQVMGLISFRKFGDEVRFGICLGRRWWGNRYGTEVISSIVPLVLRLSQVPRAAAYVDPENVRSLRMLKACGMKIEGSLPKHSLRPNLSSERRDTLLVSLVS